jgi:hypothetical protein
MASTALKVLVSGVPTLGLWCPACLLPSGYQLRVYAVGHSSVFLVGTTRACHDCGAPLPPPAT